MIEQMKPSGIDWIGNVPSTWMVKQVKYVIQNNSDGIKVGPFGSSLTNEVVGFDEGKYKVYGQANLIRKDFSFGDNYVSEQNYRRLINYEVLPNDIAVSMMGTIGKCSVVPADIQPGIMDSHLIKIRLSGLMFPRFFEYIYESCVGYEQLVLSSKGSIMNGLNSTIVKSVILTVPPKSEQQAIADYLDRQCAKIDSIASDLEKQIELLQKYKKSLITETVTKGLDKTVPMKDSGIEWFGKVPEHWEISKIKYSFSVVNGSTPDSNDFDNWDGDIHWITPADMNETGFIDHGERDITMKGYNSCGTTMLPKGSIIISTRAPIGKINISKSKLCTNQGCKSLIKTADNRYHYYLLLACQEQLIRFGRGTTFLELSSNDLKNMDIIIPSEKEQTIISNFLDKKCELIDNIISNKHAQLNTITQHKKSLIYEYVTGKKRVKEAQ